VQNKQGKLEVLKTSNAENPLMEGQTPLLTMDVWEHAYYLDYQNNRGLYVDAFLDHLVNWPFVESNMDKKA
jgi:Fe-Mn family superoxide dismutase